MTRLIFFGIFLQLGIFLHTPVDARNVLIDVRDGLITKPFEITETPTNHYLWQPGHSTETEIARASFYFEIADAGDYELRASVSASEAENSLLVNIDEEPDRLGSVWKIFPTSGFEQRKIFWQGDESLQARINHRKIFKLSKGRHQLVISGGRSKAKLESFELVQLPPAPTGLHITSFDDMNAKLVFDRLRDPDPAIRRSSFDWLRLQVGVEYDVPNLASAVTNDDVEVRRFAVSGLAKAGSQAYDAASALVFALSDPDSAVRSTAAECLGNIGPSAGFAIGALTKALANSSSDVKVAVAVALRKIGNQASSAVKELVDAAHDDNPTLRKMAIEALGSIDCDPASAISGLTVGITNATDSECRLIATSLAKIAARAQDRNSLSALIPLREAERLIENAQCADAESQSAVLRAIKYLELVPNRGPDSAPRQKVAFPDGLPVELASEKEISIDGATVKIAESGVDAGALYFLGGMNVVSNGLHWVATFAGQKRKELTYWYEENALKHFDNPYKRSYAIIAAIDDYSHSKAADFPELNFMVKNGKALADSLVGLGFPKTNIFELYDTNATSAVITKTLERFWQGGDLSKADRLFFYFGGHGATNCSSPCLVTYDYDSGRPTLTGFLMGDIVGRHFENIEARHLFVAIDACYSGLTLPRYYRSLGDEASELRRLESFRALSIIKGETEKKARNLLLAGTDQEKALWEQGGVFTQALLLGLNGGADLNNDGIIQFDELALFVKNEVRARARQAGETQEPKPWKAEGLGGGSVIFMRKRTSEPQ